MRAVIYGRVMPDNKRVAKSDNLQSQEKRCREFARTINASVSRTFTDQGAMNPPYFLQGINNLCGYLASCKDEVLVIADHPGRLGIKHDIRKMVVTKIEESGGKFIAVHSGAAAYVELYGIEIIETLKQMRF